MPTESSAVTDLIRGIHNHRLETNPGDEDLFHPPSSARVQRAGRAARGTAAPRMFERATPAPMPSSTPLQPVRPLAPRRDRMWGWVVATIIAGLGGVAAAVYVSETYLATTSEHDAASSTVRLVPAPAAIASPASPVAPVAASVVAPVPTVEPEPGSITPVSTIAPEPAATTPPTTTPALRHRSHAKPKRVVAKRAKSTTTVPAPSPEPQPVPSTRPARQALDSEKPL